MRKALATVLLMAGCNSPTAERGGLDDKAVSGPPSARYVLGACESEFQVGISKVYTLDRFDGADGVTVAQTVDDGPRKAITNHWQNGDTHHFFTWESHFGFEYLLSASEETPASLNMWILDGVDRASDGTRRPKGRKIAACAMNAVGTEG